MLAVFPKKVVINSPLSSKEFLSSFNHKVRSTKETGIFKVNRLIKNNWASDMYYGSRRENAFTLFHHRPCKRDGGGVRFNGVVVDNENGCVVAGYIRHSLMTYAVALVWTVILAMAAVVMLVEEPSSVFLPLLLIVLGNFLLFRDSGNTKPLKAFVKEIAKADEQNDQ